MAGAMGAAAQEPMATPSEEPELRTSPFPAEETAPPDRDQSVVFSPVAPRAAAEGSPFSWGPVAIRPYVSYQYLEGFGLLANPGVRGDTSIQSFFPGVLFELGKVWTFDYSQGWTHYSSRLFVNSVGQDAKLKGVTTYGDWAFKVTQVYSHTTQILLETGGETPVTDYGTALLASYFMNTRMKLETSLNQDIQTSPVAPDSRLWSSQASLHYAVEPGFDLFAGPGLGYMQVNPGFDMIYGRIDAGVSWTAIKPLTLTAQVGAESREIQGAGTPALNTGTFSGSADYEPWIGTTVTASASRDLSAANTVDDVSEITQGHCSVRQRLLEHFFVTAGAGYERVSYLSLVQNLADVRLDRYKTADVGFGFTLFRRATFEFDYSRAFNSSSAADYRFSSHQYGITASYHY